MKEELGRTAYRTWNSKSQAAFEILTILVF